MRKLQKSQFEFKLGLLISECTPTASHISECIPTASHISLGSRIVESMFKKPRFKEKKTHITDKLK
jgi:hypothetical protein